MHFSFRNICSWGIANALLLTGFVNRAKKNALRGNHILSLYFHNPSRKEFESCVKWLIKHNFTFISVSDLDRIARGDMSFPKGGVLLTIDDGWQTNEENVVEIAERYEVPVAIFISTQPVEEGAYWWSYVEWSSGEDAKSKIEALKKLPNAARLAAVQQLKSALQLPRQALTVGQVQKVARASVITIGGHTHTHPILTNCADKEVYEELSVSKYKLESWINQEVSAFAYPNGNYSKREVQALKESGYTMAFSNIPRYLTPKRLAHTYEIPRIGLLEGASFAENVCRMVGVWHPTIKRLNKLFSRRSIHLQETAAAAPQQIDVAVS